MGFRKDYVWGAASSAYQTEGHSRLDGGGECIWDAFCRRPGAIADAGDGSIACDAYHRFEEDLDILVQLGIRHYRFSTSRARVDPLGDGNWNAGGLAYYDRAVDDCLARGITPWVTLYHWELPQAAETGAAGSFRRRPRPLGASPGWWRPTSAAASAIISRLTSRRLS